MNRRQLLTTASAGLMALRGETVRAATAVDSALEATVRLAAGMRQYRVTTQQQADFVGTHRMVLAELDQLHAFDRVDSFIRSDEAKTAMLLPPTFEVSDEVNRQAAALGLPAPALRALTETEYAILAKFGVSDLEHWVLELFRTRIGPLLPVVLRGTSRPRILKVQAPPPGLTCATLVTQINVFSNVLWIVSGSWFAAGLLTAETCQPCNVVGTISGTLAGTLALAANLTQLIGGC